MIILPTASRWSVMVSNNFLCDGFDTPCQALTRIHGLTTLHWSAHDEWTVFQSGAMFHHRQKVADGSISERRVQAA